MTNKFLMTTMAVLLAACGGQSADSAAGASDSATGDAAAPVVTFEPRGEAGATAKPRAPINIDYRLVGTPVVGQPLTIDLRVNSSFGDETVTLAYRIQDGSALQFPENELRETTATPSADAEFMARQVRVIPQRAGRSFLNVSASVPTGSGSYSTVTAIPIAVGSTGPASNGEVTTDENGDAVRVLQGQ